MFVKCKKCDNYLGGGYTGEEDFTVDPCPKCSTYREPLDLAIKLSIHELKRYCREDAIIPDCWHCMKCHGIGDDGLLSIRHDSLCELLAFQIIGNL